MVQKTEAREQTVGDGRRKGRRPGPPASSSVVAEPAAFLELC